MLNVTVSGSFHRHLHAISSAVYELTDLGVRVLSPADPRIVASQGDFLFVASDGIRSVRLVQDRHLNCIRACDFLWLVAPDGYVGQSASMELGFAVANAIPIFATAQPADLTLRQYVHRVPNAKHATEQMAQRASIARPSGLFIDPHPSIEQAHDLLTYIDEGMRNRNLSDQARMGHDIHASMTRLREIVGPEL